jgi:UDP-N-acetylglucosamine 2-epimerase (non-hydrolysing)
MSGRSDSNVIPMRPTRSGTVEDPRAHTTVLHAVSDQDSLVEVAPVVAALERRPAFRQVVVHAGEGAALPPSTKVGGRHKHLDIGGDTHAERTAAALLAFEAALMDERPDVLVVAGDNDTALAAALTATKLGIAVARLGAGLRCWDWTEPDEVNRTVLDRLSDALFTSSDDAAANLRAEGVPDGRIHAVGSTRIDMLRRYEARARALAAWRPHGAEDHAYTLVVLEQRATLQPSADHLARIADALAEVAAHGPVLATRPRDGSGELDGDAAGEMLAAAGALIVEPAGYVDALSLQAGAGAIVTDVGSVAEQASALGVRCYTPLQTTPRVVTLTHGTNSLLGDDPAAIAAVRPTGWAPTPAAIPLWDGRAGERVADALSANYTLTAAFAGHR